MLAVPPVKIIVWALLGFAALCGHLSCDPNSADQTGALSDVNDIDVADHLDAGNDVGDGHQIDELDTNDSADQESSAGDSRAEDLGDVDIDEPPDGISADTAPISPLDLLDDCIAKCKWFEASCVWSNYDEDHAPGDPFDGDCEGQCEEDALYIAELGCWQQWVALHECVAETSQCSLAGCLADELALDICIEGATDNEAGVGGTIFGSYKEVMPKG